MLLLLKKNKHQKHNNKGKNQRSIIEHGLKPLFFKGNIHNMNQINLIISNKIYIIYWNCFINVGIIILMITLNIEFVSSSQYQHLSWF